MSLIACTPLLAQQLAQINYQGVARKASGIPVAEQAIALRLTIRDGGATANSVYSETRLLTTNKFGLFTTVIGSTGATSQTGTMSGVNWRTGNKFLQVEIDPEGGNRFVDMGTSQLQSVPYAIYAAEASPAGIAAGDLSGSYPNPVVSKLQGAAVSNVAPNNGQILKWNGTAWAPGDESGMVGVISSTLPLTSSTSGKNVTITINKADDVTDGYLTKTDWGIFNSKASIVYTNQAIAANTATIQTAINAKLNIADTTVMLSPYAKTAAIQTALNVKLNKADTTAMLSPYAKTLATQTAINAKLNTVDTTVMLSPYAKTLATQTAINAKLNIADTTAMLSPYAKTLATQTAINAKLNIADTTAMLSPYAKNAAIQSALNVKLNSADTTAMLIPYAKDAVIQTALNAKLNSADTTAMLLPYAKDALIQTALNAKLNSADTTAMLLPYAKDAVIQTALNAKLNSADTTAMLSPYAKNAALANLVNLDSAQTIIGAKVFSTDLSVNGLTIGLGNNNITTNTALGAAALKSNTDGSDNTAVGNQALSLNTSGVRNTAIGSGVLKNNNGNDNTAIGNLTMLNNTTGSYNAALGTETLIANTTGNQNTAIGGYALTLNTEGQDNTAVGYESMRQNISGSNNTVLGKESFRNSTTGNYNTALGVQALQNSNGASYNTAVGAGAIDANTTGNNNTALGAFAGRKNNVDPDATNTSINNSVLIGYETKTKVDNGENEIVIGYRAVGKGSNTIQLGNESILTVSTSGKLTTGEVTYPNTKGTAAGQVLITDADGIASWADATVVTDFSSDIKVNGISIGKGPGTANTNNIVLGSSALTNNTTGEDVLAIGSSALLANTTGNNNLAIGKEALKSNSVGKDNLAIGSASLSRATGWGNTAVGTQSLGGTAINYNTSIGYQAGNQNLGNNNTFLGAETGYETPGGGSDNNSTAIGYRALVSAGNQIQLGNTAITEVKTSGKLTTGEVTYPNTKGTAAGQVLTTDADGMASWVDATVVTDFSSDIKVNGITIGKGNNNNATNTAMGVSALGKIADLGGNNTAIGASALQENIGAWQNTAIGSSALQSNVSGNSNTANGYRALVISTGSDNTANGSAALATNGDGVGNTALGANADVATASLQNATAIGNGAKVNSSNTIQLGNTDVDAVKTSGKLTTGEVTYPNTKGTAAGQVLTTDEDGIASWAAVAPVSSFTTDIAVNGVTVGRGNGNIVSNTAVGSSSLSANTVGSNNTAIGTGTMTTINEGSDNTVLGFDAGYKSFQRNTIQKMNRSVLIGSKTRVKEDNEENQIVIGYDAVGNGSNTIQLGNSQIQTVSTSGDIITSRNMIAQSFIKVNGSPDEYLMADGSVSSKLKETFQFANINNSITADRSGSVFVANSIDYFGASIDENLPVGFNCEIINSADNDDYILRTANENSLFYSKQFKGVNEFSIQAGGTVRLNVITINSQKRYYLTGDIAPSVVLPTSAPANPQLGTMYLNNSTVMIYTNNGWVAVASPN